MEVTSHLIFFKEIKVGCLFDLVSLETTRQCMSYFYRYNSYNTHFVVKNINFLKPKTKGKKLPNLADRGQAGRGGILE